MKLRVRQKNGFVFGNVFWHPSLTRAWNNSIVVRSCVCCSLLFLNLLNPLNPFAKPQYNTPLPPPPSLAKLFNAPFQRTEPLQNRLQPSLYTASSSSLCQHFQAHSKQPFQALFWHMSNLSNTVGNRWKPFKHVPNRVQPTAKSPTDAPSKQKSGSPQEGVLEQGFWGGSERVVKNCWMFFRGFWKEVLKGRLEGTSKRRWRRFFAGADNPSETQSGSPFEASSETCSESLSETAAGNSTTVCNTPPQLFTLSCKCLATCAPCHCNHIWEQRCQQNQKTFLEFFFSEKPLTRIKLLICFEKFGWQFKKKKNSYRNKTLKSWEEADPSNFKNKTNHHPEWS